MAGRHPSLEGASGENVELVYGQAADGRMLHISTVPSGAACQCTCPACHMPLVAKKGGERAHHFSHASRTNCSSAPETALHKVAKEIISDELRLFLPELKVSLEGRSYIISPARRMQFQKAVSEDTSLKGIIPDLVLWASERPVFVEIMVTHPCTPEKLAFLKERDLAALEIDLSGIARDADRDVILEAAIESAPRHWVFNPISERRLSEMRARLERDRMEAEQKTLAVELALIDQYAEGVRTLDSSPPVALGEQHWIRRLGLENILGLRVAGFGCFANAPSVWQNRILSEILRRHSASAGDLRANDALKMLRDERALRDPFRFVAKEMEDRLCAREPGFLSPYRSIEAYLEGLIVAGVLKKQRGTYTLSSELARRLEALAASD